MAGIFCSEKKLNDTLLYIANLLNDNKFEIWFIAYGTLLGIVRNKSCIDGDDDIDIICDGKDFKKLKTLLSKNKFEFEYGYGIGDTKKIIKTKENNKFASIDFYMTEVNSLGDFKDLWEKTVWKKCFFRRKGEFIKMKWNRTVLNLPNNYIKKLESRYGSTWKIPIKSKGIQRGKLQTFILNSYLKLPFNFRQIIKFLVYKNKKIAKFINSLIMGTLN